MSYAYKKHGQKNRQTDNNAIIITVAPTLLGLNTCDMDGVDYHFKILACSETFKRCNNWSGFLGVSTMSVYFLIYFQLAGL